MDPFSSSVHLLSISVPSLKRFCDISFDRMRYAVQGYVLKS